MEKQLRQSNYGAEEIKVLEDLEGVRKRPAMYIGSTDRGGLHHLVWEIVDNAIDEAMAGYCDYIRVVLHEDGSVSVEDNGRGIPVEEHPKVHRPTLEVVLTKLHAGGKFGGRAYKVSGGLHGVGLSVVNALSEWLEVTVKRDGKVYQQRYERGKPVSEVTPIGDAEGTGTTVRFRPDKLIFSDIRFDYETIRERLKELAYLNSGVTIELLKEGELPEVFRFESGLAGLLEELVDGDTKVTEILRFEGEQNDVHVLVAFSFVDDFDEEIISFVNSVRTPDGGTHVQGFRSAISKALAEVGKRKAMLKDNNLTGDDFRQGLRAVVSVKVPDPEFEGQTKGKLGSKHVRGIVEDIVFKSFESYLETQNDVTRLLVQRAITSSEMREAFKRTKELMKNKLRVEAAVLPGKLADCSTKDIDKRELLIVEGESAGGSAKQGRDRSIQAVLPLRGKILNVEKANWKKVLDNQEIQALAAAIGTGVGENFDLSRLRYGKIIIMTDADVDGAHIRTLLLTFFFRMMRPLIEEGHVYIAQPPLYKIEKKRGKDLLYLYSDDELQQYLKLNGEEGLTIQRYKGLGEMNAEQLWETTLNPETRNLYRVTVEDAKRADELFSILMGEKVEPRKDFIFTNAKAVKNLDV
ncbi:DNA topoisomerase (ATP-hydrolyzing) subunit B [Coprothermobacteraceae bacterium]|nr:DNA topoisomerase (ATP-hydrolyzing) subunit B [Coprothermobacteraceae bacterium]